MRKEKFTIKKTFDETCNEIKKILSKHYGSEKSMGFERKKNETIFYPLEKRLNQLYRGDTIRELYVRVVKVNNSTTHVDVIDESTEHTNNLIKGFIDELFKVYNANLGLIAEKH